MICIVEKQKKKLSGNTSLFISFDYNREIIDAIKSVDTYFYHADEKRWEVSLTSLAELLDRFVFIDDVVLKTLQEQQKKKEEIQPSLKYKIKPFNYQLEDIKYGLNHDKFYLLLDPGLGKTAISTCIAEELHHLENIEHCLVICGIASLRDNWKKEIAKTSNLDCMIVGEKFNRNNRRVWMSISERVEQLLQPIKEFFIIINIESLESDEIIRALKNGPNKIDMIIADELHKMSGTKAKRSNNMLELTAKHLIGMTGTLLVNSPISCYNSLVWLGFESKRTLTKFKRMYCVFKKFNSTSKGDGQIVGYKNLDILQDEILSHGIRRRKSDTIELPELVEINEYLTMNDAQAKLYYNLRDAVKKNSKTKDSVIKQCDKVELKISNLLALITRLRQVTTCPNVLTSENISSVKIERAESLVDEIVSTNEKVIIFSVFKEPLNLLKDKLSKYNPLLLTGDISDTEFSDNIDKFQEDEKYKVILATISKAGTGITLTKASYVIFLDESFTDAQNTQARDRAYRIGQNKKVTVYHLRCADTIDIDVEEITHNKMSLSDYMIDSQQSALNYLISKGYIVDDCV